MDCTEALKLMHVVVSSRESDIHGLYDGRHGNTEVGGPETQDCQLYDLVNPKRSS